MTSTYITKDQNKKEIVCCSLSPLLSLCATLVYGLVRSTAWL